VSRSVRPRDQQPGGRQGTTRLWERASRCRLRIHLVHVPLRIFARSDCETRSWVSRQSQSGKEPKNDLEAIERFLFRRRACGRHHHEPCAAVSQLGCVQSGGQLTKYRSSSEAALSIRPMYIQRSVAVSRTISAEDSTHLSPAPAAGSPWITELREQQQDAGTGAAEVASSLMNNSRDQHVLWKPPSNLLQLPRHPRPAVAVHGQWCRYQP
jgi:hypothetical protein